MVEYRIELSLCLALGVRAAAELQPLAANATWILNNATRVVPSAVAHCCFVPPWPYLFTVFYDDEGTQ